MSGFDTKKFKKVVAWVAGIVLLTIVAIVGGFYYFICNGHPHGIC